MGTALKLIIIIKVANILLLRRGHIPNILVDFHIFQQICWLNALGMTNTEVSNQLVTFTKSFGMI